MGFFNFLKKAIIKEKELDLINISDIIQIPGRDYYKDDLEMIKLIDTYKEKYLLLLSQRKTMVSKDIKFDSLQDDMVMNVDLLVTDLIGDDFLNLASEELMVQIVKFKMYLSEIAKMEKETISRLIALKELKKSKKIPYRNRNCLNEEINNLSNSLIVFLSQKTAILNETDTYFSTICNVNKDTFDEDLLTKRYDKTLYCSSDIVSKEDIDEIDNLIIKIAFIDRCLEMYAYKNKNEIELLNAQLEKLYNWEKNKDNKCKLLCKITSLEQKYLVFYEYGKDIVSYDQMKKLYKVKFDILTCDIDYLRESPISEDDYGYVYYKKIIMEKIEVILKGENENIKGTFKERVNDAIEVIRESFKNDDNEFDFDEILKDKYMLNLLLSFDKVNGFIEMLDNNTLRTIISGEDANFYEKELGRDGDNCWDDIVPLKSYLSVVDTPFTYKENYKKWNIYTLYKMIDDDNDKSFYRLPEGIRCLDCAELPRGLRKLFKKQGGTFVMPSTLKIIHGDLFYCRKHPTIVLNDGLEVIKGDAFFSINNPNIVIPSSVRKIESIAFYKNNLEAIVFDDYKNSLVLHDEDSLIEMFFGLFYKIPTGNRYYQPLSDEVKEIQRKYNDGGFSVFPSSILYEHPCYMREVQIMGHLNSIVLKDGPTYIEIKLDEFSFSYYMDYSYYSPFKGDFLLDYFDALSLREKLQKVILEKTGHDIFKDNKKVRIRD